MRIAVAKSMARFRIIVVGGPYITWRRIINITKYPWPRESMKVSLYGPDFASFTVRSE
jgi:hypothetical protein